MSAENHLEFKNFLRWILDSEPSRRRELLEQADVSAEVRSEVESLIALEEEIGDFMSLPITDFSKDFIDSDNQENSTIGSKIGNYEIIGELGQGGMSAVYLAKRADGKFSQRVALKMLRREYNIEKMRRYFKRESEIQSKLEHPFIARLLDVGTTNDGVPFFAMEYVEGIPVDKFCAKNDLPLKERLKLFNKICQTVGHAHRNLIIHRDLKPSNIIVNEKGEPKLLDFGISKLLDVENSNDKTAFTALSAMTPEYASPEQMRGETVSTATDIYSLGVVLYKMLTGKLPYDLNGKTNGDVFRTISESDPIAPSSIQNSRFKIQDSNSENPQSAIRNPQLSGDIDNIILKSLSKEAARRYKTVEEFSADIWRHLDGLPVLARPSTFSYRTGKFLKRNKISVIAAAFVFASLLAGIAVAMWQAKTARAAQTNAEQQFLLAKSEEEKSKKIGGFMFKVFSYANPAWNAEGRKSGGQARVLDALDDLSNKIETEFAGEIDTQAELHHQFAEVYGRVWSYNTEPARRAEMLEKSTFHICRALELRRRFYGEWHELVAKDLYYGAGCIGKTESENAALWNNAVEMFRGTNPNNLNLPHLLVDYAHRLATPDKSAVHDIYFQAVNSPNGESKYEIAEKYYREALPLFRNHYKPDNLAIFVTECDLAYVLAIQEKWSDFDEHFAVCRQNETAIKKHYSTVENSKPTSLDLIRKFLDEKGIVR